MKKSVYDKIEDIPQIDKDESNYALCTDTGSPNNGKYVLILDGVHPVQAKNTELLVEKSQRETTQQTAIQTAVAAKETEITTLKTQLATAQAQTTVPAGHVPVPAEDAQLLQNVKTLGKFEDIKAKVEEHGTLKANEELQKNRAVLTEAATAHGLNPEAFVALAEQHKLYENLEKREIDDGKGKGGKITHWFVKGKNDKQEDTSTVLGDFVKNDNNFKPFLPSLTAKNGKVKIPTTSVGEPVEDKSAADSYLGQMYKRPDAKKDERE